jgi:hypothetical protein
LWQPAPLLEDSGQPPGATISAGRVLLLDPWPKGFVSGKLSTIDGPFTETKEIIGGYAILEAKSKEEAIEYTRQFLKVHGEEWDIECEVRQLDGPESGGEA